MSQITDVDVTAGNVLLVASSGVSDTQRPMFLRAIGTPGAARDITVPDPQTQKMYLVENTADDIVTVKTVSGVGVAVNIGSRVLLYVDETLDDVFPIDFQGDPVAQPTAWITGTLDVVDAVPALTLTYRYMAQGDRTMFQLPGWVNVIQPGGAFASFNLLPNTPAAYPAEIITAFSQSLQLYMREAGVTARWNLRNAGGPVAFVKDDLSATVANGTSMDQPHTITWTFNRSTT